jgi:hypothetical protein
MKYKIFCSLASKVAYQKVYNYFYLGPDGAYSWPEGYTETILYYKNC